MRIRHDTFIDLEECKLLFRGHMRDVYEHPELESFLIKVIRPDRVDESGQFISWRRKKLSFNRTYGLYISFHREMNEMLRAGRRQYRREGFQVPFAQVHGLIRTSQGLGLLVEKIVDADGSPAPTLSRIIKDGRFSSEHQRLLDAFFEICDADHVVIGDLHASNLVYSRRAQGPARFVCIDGIGDKALLPVHEWSAAINRRKLIRAKQRIRRELERRTQSAPVQLANTPKPVA